MPRLNVRCCCQPQKILGTLDVPETAFDNFTAHMPYELHRLAWDDPGQITGGDIVRCEIRKFVDGPHSERAVYSDDRPIEFWRKVPGFREGDEA